MHLRVQRLDPAVHHFGKAGEVRDVLDLKPGRRDRLRGAAGGDQLDAVACQRAGEFDQSGLVGNGQQSAGYAARMVGHGQGPPVRGCLSPGARRSIPRFADGAPSKVASRARTGWLAALPGRQWAGAPVRRVRARMTDSLQRQFRLAPGVAAGGGGGPTSVERTKLQRTEAACRESCRITIWAVRRGPSLPARNTLSSRSTLSSSASKVQTSRLGSTSMTPRASDRRLAFTAGCR